MSNQEDRVSDDGKENGKKKLFNADNFKTIVSENLAATTIHGINNVYVTSSDIFLRFILIASFFTSSGLCCYFIVKTMTDYLSFNVLSSNTIISDIPAECINFE
jgi:hypothetical protein